MLLQEPKSANFSRSSFGKKETIFASQDVQSVHSLLLGYSLVLHLCGIYRSCACDRVICTTDMCIVVHETLGGMTSDLRGG